MNIDNPRVSKYKNTFVKGYILNWTEEFVVKEVKNIELYCAVLFFVIGYLNGNVMKETFGEQEVQKA